MITAAPAPMPMLSRRCFLARLLDAMAMTRRIAGQDEVDADDAEQAAEELQIEMWHDGVPCRVCGRPPAGGRARRFPAPGGRGGERAVNTCIGIASIVGVGEGLDPAAFQL
jgi:hypothetical protein